jgi:hypothetical protein
LINVGWTARFGEQRSDGRKPRHRADAEAIEAAFNVDRRRKAIKDEQRRKAKEQADADDGRGVSADYWSTPPRTLTRAELACELRGYSASRDEEGDDDWQA